MATANRLIERIYSCIEEWKLYEEKLKKLAQEVESLRRKCNVGECFGSSYSVIGGGCMVGAGLATLLTGGAAVPFLVALGTACAITGKTISMSSKTVEWWKTSKTRKDAEKLQRTIQNTEETIRTLIGQLVEEVELSVSGPYEGDRYLLAEMLGSIAKRNGLNISSSVIKRRMTNTTEIQLKLSRILETFGIIVTWKERRIQLTRRSRKFLGRQMYKLVLMGGTQVLEGADILTTSLPELFANWKELFKDRHVTEASQCLRDMANNIQQRAEKLRQLLDDIKYDRNTECRQKR
ncbi:uncharacterized protein [Antennarius striatus]|uniref:uncharacterized protein isoform X2 n=1 Tax=Antennarius striatus TaxID=241820 RepID=UPI0035B1005A